MWMKRPVTRPSRRVCAVDFSPCKIDRFRPFRAFRCDVVEHGAKQGRRRRRDCCVRLHLAQKSRDGKEQGDEAAICGEEGRVFFFDVVVPLRDRRRARRGRGRFCACARAPQDRGWCRSAHRRVPALAPSYTYSSSPPGWSGDLRRCCQNVTTVAPASCRLHPIEYSIVCNHSSQRFIKPSRFQASKAAAAVSRPAQCVRNAALAPRGSHAAPALPGSAPRRAASLEPVAPAWTLALDT